MASVCNKTTNQEDKLYFQVFPGLRYDEYLWEEDTWMNPLLLFLPPRPDYENLLQSNGDRQSCLSMPLFAPPLCLFSQAALPHPSASRVSGLWHYCPLCLSLRGILNNHWSASPTLILCRTLSWSAFYRSQFTESLLCFKKRGIKVQTGLD